MDERPGTKIAEQLMTRPDGATMDEIVAATGGPQYNVLRRLEGRGYRIRKVKEGRATRYFAEAPESLSYEATATNKRQITIPKEVWDRMHLSAGATVRFTVDNDRIVVTRGGSKLSDLFGILGKPPRSLTLEEMDEVIAQAAVDRYLRAVRRRKR